MKKIATLSLFLLLGAGCASPGTPGQQDVESSAVTTTTDFTTDVEPSVDLPMETYIDHRTLKTFGEYIEDRFTGYHVGDDVEVDDVNEEYPVYAIADGVIRQAGSATGYGGVIVIDHTIEDETISAIYGHVDLNVRNWTQGEVVKRGELLANLGDHNSAETDGERKHLHFGLYRDDDVRLAGYESRPQDVSKGWVNPTDFFLEHGIDVTNPSRVYDGTADQGNEVYNLSFQIPEGWEVEYVPSIKSLNLYTIAGEGDARERSQIFIRYFDASSFLTLGTVEIHSTEELTIGAGNYNARRYDIEKRDGVSDFSEQPSWRNERHVVTDFRSGPGYTRYFVIAANPELDSEIYEDVLASMFILE